MGAIIGRRGETLDAIQQLTSYSVNRTGSRVRVQLDAENYRAKREQSLERLANKVAGKVVKYRRSVTLEPMNAYERHVIHTALQEVPGVTTYSTGCGPQPPGHRGLRPGEKVNRTNAPSDKAERCPIFPDFFQHCEKVGDFFQKLNEKTAVFRCLP